MVDGKLCVLAVFLGSALFVQLSGCVRLKFWRQLTDHSTFMAPFNCLVYLFSGVPLRPYLRVEEFRELQPLAEHWQAIRDEAERLDAQGAIKASARYDDAGFKALCPVTTALLRGKRLKARSRFGYCLLKWLLFGGPLLWWLLS